MILESIVLENWLAFAGRHELEELPALPIAVVARYADDPQRSNWAGKTAFLEAIEWALFGVHRKRYEDEVIFRGADFTRVRLELPGAVAVEGKLRAGAISVERSRKRGKPTRIVVEAGGERFEKGAAEEKVEELLGFGADDYRATVCFAQGDTEAIVERTSGERRKVVGAWLELDAWLRVAARARAYSRELSNEYRSAQSEVDVWRKELEGIDVPVLEDYRDRVNAELVEARSFLAAVEAELEAVAANEVNRQNRKRFEVVVEEGRGLRAKLEGAEVAGLEACRGELAKLQADSETARRELEEAGELARGSFDGTCPVTCEECPVAEDVRGNRKAARERLDKARAPARVASDVVVVQRREVAALETEEREFDRLRERYKLLLREAKRLKESAEAYDEDAEMSDAEIEKLREAKRERRDAEVGLSSRLSIIGGELERRDDLHSRIVNRELELGDLEKRLRTAHLVSRATGPSGIPARIAEASLGVLGERANELLVGSGLSFEFAWDRETRDLAPHCFECGYVYKGRKDKACPACEAPRGMKRADELEILVDDGSGVPEDVKQKSGGAKVLIGSAIRLAAGLMLRELRGSRCAWAQIDEPFGALDAKNRRDLARTFSSMLGAVGLEQAFVVSHDAALLDALPGRIEIMRHSDRSTIEVVR